MIEEHDPEGDDPIEIKEFQWATSSAPRNLGSGAFDPCIGVVIMNDTQKTAWALHSPAMRMGEGGLRAFLSYADQERREGDQVRIAVVGGHDTAPRSKRETAADRAFTLATIAELVPGAPVRVAWGKTPGFMLTHDDGTWRDTLGSPTFKA